MTRMKKLVSILLSLALVVSLGIPCAADEMNGLDWSGNNVSTVNPFELYYSSIARGTSYPTVSHNCHGAPLEFSGNASYSMLWLNKVVYGCSGYYVYVKNNAGTPLNYIVRGGTYGDRAMTVSPYSDSYTDNGGNPVYIPMSSHDALFCISFDAPSNFRGSVRCGCSFGG